MLIRALLTALYLAVLSVAAPAAASEPARPMTGAEFEAYTTGHTLTFGIAGTVYGIEQYLPNRRVIWRFLGEECRRGSWFDDGPEICFIYDEEPDRLHCWTFHETPRGLRARLAGDGEGSELIEVLRSEAPLMCPGEFLGA